MALINKFFTTSSSSRKTTQFSNKQNAVSSDKLFAFNAEQVRLVLFRECDFRGRKLLFDSHSIKKVPLNNNEKENTEKFTEISNGFGYLFTKSQTDCGQIAEMIFGSVAMSYRGTYFKIHNLFNPPRLMFTQVFPSPPYPNRKNSSISSRHSIQSLEHSIKLDDSGASSNNSTSEQLSQHSTVSDTVLICRSSPLDVPNNEISISNPNIAPDSGYSYNSIPNYPLSSSSLYKRILRSTSMSLDRSVGSLTGSESADDSFTKTTTTQQRHHRHNRNGKLGLALIIELTQNQEEIMVQFLMEHIVLLHSMLTRTIHVIKKAYNRPSIFTSLIYDITNLSSIWLVNLLSGPYLVNTVWRLLYNNNNDCDNNDSINKYYSILNNLHTSNHITNNTRLKFTCLFDLKDTFINNTGLLGDFSKILRNERNVNVVEEKTMVIEKFLKEFCETMEAIDVKSTNFFMSTLLTAVLTHHLGWVSTCLPTRQESHQNDTYNNYLWGQLSSLYGTVGHPTKMAQTIITGTNNKNDLITKILNCLAYFIRCTDIVRYNVKRLNINEENKQCEMICIKNKCISTVDEKNYEDLVKELMVDDNNKPQMKKNALTRTNKCDSIAKVCCSNDDFIKDGDNDKDNKVIFVLGDSDELIGLNKEKNKRPFYLNLNKTTKIDKITECEELKASTSWSSLEQLENIPEKSTAARCQSEPPEQHTKIKNKYSGQMKFNLQQYPQIVKNYMKSKNLELANLSLSGEDKVEFSELNNLRLDFSEYESDSDDVLEALQTPSNASELLEFTSDLFVDMPKVQNAKESSVELTTTKSTFSKKSLPNTVIKEIGEGETEKTNNTVQKMKIINFPMPQTKLEKETTQFIPYTSTLIKGLVDNYVPDLVLQGTTLPKHEWDYKLKSDLSLNSQHSLLDQQIEEAIAIVANTDNWEVQIVSSHTYVIDKVANNSGVRVGMSQLVANMLETVVQMWKLHVPPQYCLMHIEQKLQELCIRSKALAQLLLASEFCNMELLISTLDLEVNDVPLLLAIASTHTPQVTQKYGLSFQ